MPHQLEAFKLAERGNMDAKGLSRWMLVLIAVAMPLCILMLLDTFLELGVDTGRVGKQSTVLAGGRIAACTTGLIRRWRQIYPIFSP